MPLIVKPETEWPDRSSDYSDPAASAVEPIRYFPGPVIFPGRTV